MKILNTVTVQETYKNASITLTIGTWSDGTFSLAKAQYIFDGSNRGAFIAPADASRFFSTMDAARKAGLTWAKEQIDTGRK
jgi:hypothetical protein